LSRPALPWWSGWRGRASYPNSDASTTRRWVSTKKTGLDVPRMRSGAKFPRTSPAQRQRNAPRGYLAWILTAPLRFTRPSKRDDGLLFTFEEDCPGLIWRFLRFSIIRE